MLLELGKEEQAEHAFKKAIQQNPKYAEARINLRRCCTSSARMSMRCANWAKALKSAPTNQRAWWSPPAAEARRGSFTSAEQACRLALKEDPDNAEALTVLGSVLHELDRYDEAVEMLEKAANLAPLNAETLSYYGVALKSVGRLDDAREKIIKGVQLNPNMIGAYANLNDLVDYSKETQLYERLTKIMERVGATERRAAALHYAYAKASTITASRKKRSSTTSRAARSSARSSLTTRPRPSSSTMISSGYSLPISSRMRSSKAIRPIACCSSSACRVQVRPWSSRSSPAMIPSMARAK